ncbi:hypothetical protein, partial [Tsuneonella suprasediminis]|uniref:hypothetical protein n=1 Tax=Tsuneonella suprasediminis TaxID=2306996 RepID=UPI002F93269C
MISITRPGASAPTTTITYGTDGRVSSVTKDGVTKNYTWSTSGGNDVVAVSGGSSGSGTVTTTPSTGQPGTVTNATSNTVSNTYDANKRLKRTTWPEGNYVEYTYDARGNITQTLFVPKSGSGLANISTSANFDTACTSLAKCNRPNYTIDAKGNRTDYTYDPTHGQVTRVRLPAPASGQPRPQIDYSYTALYAKEKNASGTLVNVLTPQYKLTQITRCATAATCTGTANETKITIAYDTPNLQPTSVTVAAGNGSLSSTTAYAYDNRDNLVSVDGPLPGSGDTEYYFYDATDRRIGSISPDPDGAGGNPRIAQRVSYDIAGRVWKVESGVASGPTLSDLNAMTVLRSLETTFDTNSRKLTQVLKDSGGNKVSLTQFSYDSAGRLQCTAVRMNPAIYGSLPASACTLGTTGSHGPDRITKLYYDANGRTIRQESGVGTAAVGTDGAMTYTANSKVQTATDGEANRTTYEYDGFDRLAKVRFPVATKGANASSTTDYEQYDYDANSNVVTRRTRANETLSFAYDALDRLTRKVVPERSGLSSTHTRDVYYGYDLMGRPLYARFDSASGDGISFAYDALGRMTSTTQAMDGASRTITSAFNTAGARTSLQFPDGNLVNYNRDELNRLHYAELNAGGYLFYTPYKADGSLSALYRLVTSTAAWGLSDANTKYYYDPLGRLSTIATDMLGSSNDTSTNFTYNPASQIASLTRTNDAYAWTGHANVDRNYTTNGLNQYTAAGPASFTYDANGNLTSDGSNTYVYDVENRLVSRSGGGTSATLRYDPLGRLYEVSGSASEITRFLYDGDALVGEYNSAGALLRRYVHGAAEGVDDPLVWFEG